MRGSDPNSSGSYTSLALDTNLEAVASDLLLVAGAARVAVPHGVHVRVRVQPAGAPVRVPGKH